MSYFPGSGMAAVDYGPQWNPDKLIELIDHCVRSTFRRFGEGNLKAVGIQAEVTGYMQGFVDGRGFHPDITDVLVAALTEKINALSEERSGS